MAFTFQTQKQFKCNGCGGEISLISKRTNFVGCPYCGAVTDTQSVAYKVIANMEKPSYFTPYTFLKVGMIGTFEGKQHKIIGRTRFNSNYKEYWSDDEGSGYSDETWQYDEWQLLGEDFTYFYLIEDAEGFEFSHVFYPKYPNLPNGNNIKAFLTNSSQRLDEYGSTKIIYFEGEATYQVKVGNTHNFAMYKKGKDKYEVETRLADNSNQLNEISFYREEHHSPEEILEAFKNDESVVSFAEVFEKERKSRRIVRRMYTAACVICFFMLFFSIGEQNILNQNFTMADYKVVNKNDSLIEYEIYSDFFELKDVGRVHGFRLSVEMPDNMDSYTEIEINDDKGDAVNDLVGNFYRSSGYDGESWTEDDVAMEEYYDLDSAGRYQVKMNVQLLPSQNYPQDIKYTLAVYRTDLSRYYLMGFSFFMILAIFTNRPPKVLKEVKKRN